MKIMTINGTLVTLVALLFSAQSIAATEMPRLQFGVGDVKAISVDGQTRPLKKGDILRPGEKLVTGPGAMAQLRIFQQGVVVLRDNGQLQLKKPVDGRYGVALDKGLMRTVTKLGFKLGKIDVATPVAQIDVQSGDMLTGVGTDQSARTTTHNHVFDGLVKIRTSNEEKVADIGKIFQINPIGGAVTVIDRVPDSMKLRLPPPSRTDKAAVLNPDTSRIVGQAFDSDRTKIAVLRPDTPTVVRPNPAASRPLQLAVPTPVASGVAVGARGAIAGGATPVKPSYRFEIFDPRITTGSPEDMKAVNEGLIVGIRSQTTKSLTFKPVVSDPEIKKQLTNPIIVPLTPTTRVAGETTLSSPVLPVKIVTFEPEKIIQTSTTYNPELVKSLSTTTTTTKTTTTTTTTLTSPIKTTTCLTCTKSLTLLP